MAVSMWVGMAYVHVYTSVNMLGVCVPVDAKISVTCLPQLCSRLFFDKGSLIEPRAHPFSLTGWLMRSNDPPITYTNIHTHRQTHSTLCMSAEDPNGKHFSV